METITEAKTIEGIIQIWAIPEREWVDNEYRYSGEWDYQLRIGNPYERGAVKVCEHHVALTVPPGVDLRQQAVKTLEEEIKEKRASHYKEISELQQQINSLLMLTHQPNTVDYENPTARPVVIEGELSQKEDSDGIPF